MNTLAGKKVLVTGGGSFIAGHTVPALIDAGAHVFVVASSTELPWRLEPFKKQIYFAALTDYSEPSLSTLLEKTDPDVIVHLAGKMPRRSKVDEEFFKSNLDNTVALYRAAEQAGVEAFVSFGTAFEYEEAPLPWTEDKFGNPQSAYGKSKAAATQELERISTAKTTVTILRPSTVFGPSQSFTMAIPTWIKLSLERGTLQVVPGTNMDLIYVADVVNAILKACERRGTFRTFNIASGIATSLQEAAQAVATEVGYEHPSFSEFTGAPARTVGFSIDRAKNELGWEPKTPFETALKETVRWYQEHKDLFPRLVVA